MKKIALILFVLITLGSASLFADWTKTQKVSSNAECEDLCFRLWGVLGERASQWRTEPSQDPSMLWCFCYGPSWVD